MNKKYSAKDIEVLEGLEPVRRRPGMYIGGCDQNAIHHMFNEVLDNSMDEAVAGHADFIEVILGEDGSITVSDNGRGIPVDPHPKFPKQSALEVILTTLHSGGKFNTNVYATSGGLHGVGISVVNALSEYLVVSVARDGKVYTQSYAKGIPQSGILESEGIKRNTGTKVTFIPDPEIFGNEKYNPETLYNITKSKAYLYKGVTISWKCYHEKSLTKVKADDTIHYPNGIKDYVETLVPPENRLHPQVFYSESETNDPQGKVECAFVFNLTGDSVQRYYCNTIYSPEGGTHEHGMKSTLLKALKNHANLVNYKGFDKVASDDIVSDLTLVLSIFIPHPSFQGQTKEKLLSKEVLKLIDVNLRDRLEHMLANNPTLSELILDRILQNANERIRRKASREASRKNPLSSIRLPGKLTDCYDKDIENTEIFIVEGESAGGTAKQARNRQTQAILPLKGKILNVANNSQNKIDANQEISDLIMALGCGIGKDLNIKKLRYGKVIIMTDADVDGAHICSLILTFFYMKMPELLASGYVYLAKPPLYRISSKDEQFYVYSDQEKDQVLSKMKSSNIMVNRFKGLGEMTSKQLKETTMDEKSRTLYKVVLTEDSENTNLLVESLMGKKPELRFQFIRQNASIFEKSA